MRTKSLNSVFLRYILTNNLVLCALVSSVIVLFAATPAQVYAQPGELSGFSFLRLESSARAASLGGSFNAIYDDDVNTLFYNPALLNEQMHRSLSVSFLNHVSDLRAGFLAYSFHADRIGSVGFGLRYLSWGSLDKADEQGNDLGSFSANDVAFTIGLSRLYSEQVYVGANLHSIISSVDSYTASALAADIGVVYHSLNGQFSLSTSINNIGVTLSSLGATNDELPLDFRVGLSGKLRHLPLLISVTGYNLHNYDTVIAGSTTLDRVMEHIAVGGEFQFSESFNLRFGYNHRRHQTLKQKSRLDFAGLGFGIGIKVSRIHFDYAFNSWSSLGGLNQFTLRTAL
ncbi:MAG: type IX secretion system protein PorQ [Rhodothermales bacterium]